MHNPFKKFFMKAEEIIPEKQPPVVFETSDIYYMTWLWSEGFTPLKTRIVKKNRVVVAFDRTAHERFADYKDGSLSIPLKTFATYLPEVRKYIKDEQAMLVHGNV